MSCKGICLPFKADKPHNQRGRYVNGQVRCQICELFLKAEDCKLEDKLGLWCPCCGYRVRSKPRSKVYKEKLREKLNAT